ncbi:hypothetical protein ZWY2020_047701 [Hordeum vulgare]|nr:hypothetical protein ZWY2020_047701 [Hordeum vulgare]
MEPPAGFFQFNKVSCGAAQGCRRQQDMMPHGDGNGHARTDAAGRLVSAPGGKKARCSSNSDGMVTSFSKIESQFSLSSTFRLPATAAGLHRQSPEKHRWESDFVVSSACSPATVQLLQLRRDAGAHGRVPRTVPQLTYWSSTYLLIKLAVRSRNSRAATHMHKS